MVRIAVHNTAVSRTSSPQLLGVNRYHKDKWDMKSSLGWYVGYNEFVDVDGKRTKCRKFGEETIANRGHNCDVPDRCDIYSVCFALDGERQQFNAAQEKSFRDILDENPEWGITRHADIQENRTCPGSLITQDYLMSLVDNPDNKAEKEEEISKKQRSFDKFLLLLRILLGR